MSVCISLKISDRKFFKKSANAFPAAFVITAAFDVAFGWSPTDKVGHTICSIAVGRSSKNVHFGFYWGSELSDPDKILLGQGNQYRYILVTDKKKFPKAYIKKLVNEAYANSLAKVKDTKQIISGQTIVKSVSDKKRPDKVKKAAKAKKK